MEAKQRTSWRLGAAIAACVGASMLSACVVAPARPPEPAPRVEVMPAAPAPGYHWVKGHYRWEGGAWAWVPGHWAPGY
nr:YXWGXW repeat-containing protein [Paraburkholderia phosphatilytica]